MHVNPIIPPPGIYKDKAKIEEIFKKSIAYHAEMFEKAIADFSANPLSHDWRSLIRAVEELINIPLEVTQPEVFKGLHLDLMNDGNKIRFKMTSDMLERVFDPTVAQRFRRLSVMSNAIGQAYSNAGMWANIGHGLNLSTVGNAIDYYQSRRLQFGAVLNLIPTLARGSKCVPDYDLLNQLLYTIDTCLVGITGAYYHLLVNECLDDYELTFDGSVFKPNFQYEYLENFFLEPERLSLMDQVELRPDVVVTPTAIPKPQKAIFSFNEIAAAMALFEGAFDKYKVSKLKVYDELNRLLMATARYCTDNYNVVIEEAEFDAIQATIKSLVLTIPDPTYLTVIHNYAPFQKFEGKYYSTVVLLSRFVYRSLTEALMHNKSFMINSGFIFEDKVAKVLEAQAYQLTGITRINRKEFDLITIKNNKVYNFQCKNNYIDIARVSANHKVLGRLNGLLIKYYRKSIKKEEDRENLVIKQTGIKDISHFVISRYPVITHDTDIINYNSLENWLKRQKH